MEIEFYLTHENSIYRNLAKELIKNNLRPFKGFSTSDGLFLTYFIDEKIEKWIILNIQYKKINSVNIAVHNKESNLIRYLEIKEYTSIEEIIKLIKRYCY